MEPLSQDQLNAIAEARGIEYVTPSSEPTVDGLVIRTVLSRNFPIAQEAAYNTFADPQNHIRFFTIIKACTPLIPLEGVLPPDEYIVLEHVQEQNLPPRMMLVKYTLKPPASITKEAVTNPFNEFQTADRKKGKVSLVLNAVDRNTTKLTCDSTFKTNGGEVFVRGFIDHVWLNFYERLMVETGELSENEMLTRA